MFWYTVLAIAAALFLLSVASPTLRRVWAFSLYASKYLLLRLFDLMRLRLVWARMRGAPYQRLTGPVAARLFCEDMGPTFLKFGQIVASSAGMFPARYSLEFQKVLDRVRPFSYQEVQEIVGEELG